jgi:hypothetical protein
MLTVYTLCEPDSKVLPPSKTETNRTRGARNQRHITPLPRAHRVNAPTVDLEELGAWLGIAVYGW